MGDDEAMLDLVSSANIACGFHAGDPLVMRRTCAAALERGVAVGAHVAYRDLAGFGRRAMDVAPDELEADVLYQLAALGGMCRSLGGRVRHVKPHGALYTVAAGDPVQARAVAAAVAAYDPDLVLLAPPGSELLSAATAAGLPTESEAFADRAYRADGTLVPRREPGAVLDDPAAIAGRVVHLARTGTVTAVDGTEVAVSAGSVCVHGDSPGAVAIARAVRDALDAEGVAIRSFSAGPA